MAGEVAVTVAGQTTLPSSLTYFSYTDLVRPPTVATASPLHGPATGGTVLTVAGAGFGVNARVALRGQFANGSLTGTLSACDWETPATPGLGCNDTTIM